MQAEGLKDLEPPAVAESQFTMPKDHPFSDRQISHGLQTVLIDYGYAPFDDTMEIQRYFVSCGASLPDLELITLEIGRAFGLEIANSDWNQWLNGSTTFGQLSQVLADRLPYSPLESRTVFGKQEKEASVFLGIQGLVEHIDPTVERFGPSTMIRRRLNNYLLTSLWRRLEWISEGRVFPLRDALSPKDSARRATDLLIFFCCIASLILWTVGLHLWNPKNVELGSIVCTLGIVTSITLFYYGGHYLLRRSVNPLPRGIKTFGDLAKHLCHLDVSA